jgi:hypothetical protein
MASSDSRPCIHYIGRIVAGLVITISGCGACFPYGEGTEGRRRDISKKSYGDAVSSMMEAVSRANSSDMFLESRAITTPPGALS